MISKEKLIARKINKIYQWLLEEYGSQGWWPLIELHNNKVGNNPTKTGSVNGYHPEDYSFPQNDNHKFEIISGALLTQNTSWPQVEMALLNLEKNNIKTPEDIATAKKEDIATLIKPAGYFNQKAERLQLLASWFMDLEDDYIPPRDEVLSLKGVGPETADSILLYAFNQPEFVVDAYTVRMLTNLKLIKKTATYDDIKELFENSLDSDYKMFQEYHALIVEHAKRYYSRNSPEDPLLKLI